MGGDCKEKEKKVEPPKPKPPPICACKYKPLEDTVYDLETFSGRLRHFIAKTNPFHIFASSETLEKAKDLVQTYKCRQKLPSGTNDCDLWKAVTLYNSAFFPDTGEKIPLIARLNAQIPINTFVLGGMMTYCNSTSGLIFWQWLYQSINALVNYTNNPCSEIAYTEKQLLASYLLATTVAVGTTLGLKKVTKCMSPLAQRLVPLGGVVAGNMVNVPMLRAQELRHGTPIYDMNGAKVGYSKIPSQIANGQVIVSRIAMILPGLILTPVVMDLLEKRGTLCRYPWIELPGALGIVGLLMAITTPLAYALFKEKGCLPFSLLEPDLKDALGKKHGSNTPLYVLYNKHLLVPIRS